MGMRAAMSDVLAHLTLNTGHVRQSRRSEVAYSVIAALRPLIAAGGGPAPGMAGWYVDLMFPLALDGAHKPGAAFFQIARQPGMSKAPAVMCIAAWSPELSVDAWRDTVAGYNMMRDAIDGLPAPEFAPPTPWLAAWLTPFTVDANPEMLMAIDDLERCVAWGLIGP
jgi:hypothetical protein